jgi:hypothetical protein
MNQRRTFQRFFITRPDWVTVALFAVALAALAGSLVLAPTPAHWEVLKGKSGHQIRIFHDPKHLADYLILALRVLAIGSLIGAWIRHADRASTIQDVIDQEARDKDDGVAASHVGAVHLNEPRHY